MSLQSELNLMADEFLNPWNNDWKWNILLLSLVSALIGFSVHGWLCIQNIIQGDKKFCEISFNIAIILELIFGFFILPPILMAIFLNCFYPKKPGVYKRKSEGLRAVAPRIPDYTVLSPSPLRIVRSNNNFNKAKGPPSKGSPSKGSPIRRASLS